jgi:FixJ family two-component response regulator
MKPFRDEDLLSAVDQAIKRDYQIEQLKNKPTQKHPYPEAISEMVGKSAALRQVLQQVETVAPTDSTGITEQTAARSAGEILRTCLEMDVKRPFYGQRT